MTEKESTPEGEGIPPRRPRLKALLTNLALIGASTLIALLVAEVAIRIVAPQQLILIRPDVWEAADTVGWLHRPNVATQLNTGERTIDFYTDAEGFRVGGDGRVQAEHEVLVLGDSFMEALQVDYEQSGPGLLQDRLSAALNEPVAVRDAGIGGWDPDQYLLRARTLVPAADYDAVLVAVYLGNDVLPRARDYIPPRAPVRRYHLRLPRSLSWSEFVDSFLRPLNDFLEVRSHLFLFFKNRLQEVRMRTGLAVLDFPESFLSETADSGQWDVTAGLLQAIDTLARSYDVPTLFVLIPTPFQIDPVDLARYVEGYGIDPDDIDLDQPNRIMREELDARGLEVIDLLPVFRQAHQEGTRLYGAVDQHFTPAGNRLFADEVTPELVALLKGNHEPDSSDPPVNR
jgi:hypothetical protein